MLLILILLLLLVLRLLDQAVEEVEMPRQERQMTLLLQRQAMSVEVLLLEHILFQSLLPMKKESGNSCSPVPMVIWMDYIPGADRRWRCRTRRCKARADEANISPRSCSC